MAQSHSSSYEIPHPQKYGLWVHGKRLKWFSREEVDRIKGGDEEIWKEILK